MVLRYSDIKKKEVINVETGKSLGKVVDLTFDEKSGRILTLTVPGKKNSFLSCESEELKFNCIIKFGDDTILYKNNIDKINEEHHKCCDHDEHIDLCCEDE